MQTQLANLRTVLFLLLLFSFLFKKEHWGRALPTVRGHSIKKSLTCREQRLLSDWLVSSVISLVNLSKVILRAEKNGTARGSFGGVG